MALIRAWPVLSESPCPAPDDVPCPAPDQRVGLRDLHCFGFGHREDDHPRRASRIHLRRPAVVGSGHRQDPRSRSERR